MTFTLPVLKIDRAQGTPMTRRLPTTFDPNLSWLAGGLSSAMPHRRRPLRSCIHLIVWLAAVMLWPPPSNSATAGEQTAWRLQTLTDARPRAVKQVLDSSRSDAPFLRANAIEAAQQLSQRVGVLVQLGLEDPSPAVRFAAAATVGKLRLVEMAETTKRLLTDPSASVRAAALSAIHLCGNEIDLSPLALMLKSPRPTVRGNAAMLLGEMNNPTATTMLKDLARSPMPRTSAVQEAIVRIQLAEAIVKLGDDSALNAVRAGVYSQFDEVRVLAVSMLGQLGDHRMGKAIAQMLLTPPIELQIAAAGALARLGRHEGESIVLDACRSDLPTVRAQGALTLGLFESDRAIQTLLGLLDDAQEQVRLSAAAAILQLCAGR